MRVAHAVGHDQQNRSGERLKDVPVAEDLFLVLVHSPDQGFDGHKSNCTRMSSLCRRQGHAGPVVSSAKEVVVLNELIKAGDGGGIITRLAVTARSVRLPAVGRGAGSRTIGDDE